MKQRKDLAESCGAFGDAMSSLGASEQHKTLASVLVHLGQNENKIKGLFIEQATAESEHLEALVDEYVRTVASVKHAFNARARAFHAANSAENTFGKKKDALEKVRSNPKSSAKVAPAEKEVEEAELALKKAKEHFQDISVVVKGELEKFDKQKVRSVLCVCVWSLTVGCVARWRTCTLPCATMSTCSLRSRRRSSPSGASTSRRSRPCSG